MNVIYSTWKPCSHFIQSPLAHVFCFHQILLLLYFIFCGYSFSLLLVNLKGRVPFSNFYEIYCRLLPVTWRLMSGLCDTAAEPENNLKQNISYPFPLRSVATLTALDFHVAICSLVSCNEPLFSLQPLLSLPQFLLCSQTPPPPLPQKLLTYCT